MLPTKTQMTTIVMTLAVFAIINNVSALEPVADAIKG